MILIGPQIMLFFFVIVLLKYTCGTFMKHIIFNYNIFMLIPNYVFFALISDYQHMACAELTHDFLVNNITILPYSDDKFLIGFSILVFHSL